MTVTVGPRRHGRERGPSVAKLPPGKTNSFGRETKHFHITQTVRRKSPSQLTGHSPRTLPTIIAIVVSTYVFPAKWGFELYLQH